MESLKKNIERISKNINSEIYEIYIYEEKLEISDKSHYIKIDKNVGLLHIFKLLNIKQNYLSNKDILLTSKNSFSFKYNKDKKIKNFKK